MRDGIGEHWLGGVRAGIREWAVKWDPVEAEECVQSRGVWPCRSGRRRIVRREEGGGENDWGVAVEVARLLRY